MVRSRLDKIFTNASSIDLLIYIHNHPGCRKSDIYSSVTRNVHTLEKLQEFADAGLLSMDTIGNRAFMTLTEKGMALANVFEEAQAILDRDFD